MSLLFKVSKSSCEAGFEVSLTNYSLTFPAEIKKTTFVGFDKMGPVSLQILMINGISQSIARVELELLSDQRKIYTLISISAKIYSIKY